MGLDNRDYGRANYEGSYGYGQQPGVHLGAPQTMVIKLVIINVVVFVVQLLTRSNSPFEMSWFDNLFSMHTYWFHEPWRVYELLTYGFLHDTFNMWHIVGNMFVLWMFGRTVEERIGSKEFLLFYLCGILAAALCWNLTELIAPGATNQPLGVSMLGASGGVSAVLLLFVFYYPRMTILLMFVIPMPAWLFGLFIVGSDMWGAIARSGGVAFTAHLGGFLFAFLYHKADIRLTDYVPTSFKLPSFKRKPPLRVHRPSEDEDTATEKRLDELLAKVATGGQESLTSSERRELQKLSKHYQQKRR